CSLSTYRSSLTVTLFPYTTLFRSQNIFTAYTHLKRLISLNQVFNGLMYLVYYDHSALKCKEGKVFMIKLNHKMVPLEGHIEVPGDKSMSHRAIMLASLAEVTTVITNFSSGEDNLRTIAAFKQLGITIERKDSTVYVHGKGIDNLQEPPQPIYFGNSGTTARLMIGLLAGLPLFSTVYGDESLSNRPMRRVV